LGGFVAGGAGLDWGRGKWDGKGREGEVEGREREGPKLLLNQGPSEPCYATERELCSAAKYIFTVCITAS